MEDTAKTIEILNDLILINNDRIEGYERSLKQVEESNSHLELQPMFLRFIDDSRRYKTELGTEVRRVGQGYGNGHFNKW